jgi:TPR repeat protein
MSVAFSFMKIAAKAVLNAVGGGITGDILVEVLPEVASEVWQWWGKGRSADQIQKELEAVAQLTPAEAVKQAGEAVAVEAGERSNTEQAALTLYLTLIPDAIRQSQRRLTDPTGRTISPGFSVVKPDDLVPLLPARLPRFKPGDRPTGLGDLELVEMLGAGGFGEVWKARNHFFDGVPPVALKFCLDPTAKDRLLHHEAAVLNQVMRQGNHPGIVPLLDSYLGIEPPCLKYEFVAGGDLGGVIRDAHPRGGLPPRQAARIVQEVAEAIGFAHSLKPPIVHRDLKPANILVQRADGKLVFYVADFGIGGAAVAQALGQTRLGATRGHLLVSSLRGSYTPLYASPQQLRGEDPDPRDDVYSLGVIWYQLLTADLFVGAPAGGAWKKRLTERGMDPSLIELLEECINHTPADQPANAAVVAERIAAIIDKKKPPWPPDGLEREMQEALEEMRTKSDARAYFKRQGPARIVTWQAAAEQDNQFAQWLLACCLQEGIGGKKQIKAAVGLLKKAAEKGLPAAQSSLGDCYYLGEGVKANPGEAFRLYTEAAESGLMEAQINLGDCYYEGMGVKQDLAQAARLYRQAAEAGWARGQSSLGDCYFTGSGVQQDFAQAIAWYRKAAEQGEPTGQLRLAYCHEHGRGVKEGLDEAAKWYGKAAEQGDANSEFALGYCYEHGRGIGRDIEQAKHWYRKAADQDHSRAVNALDRLLNDKATSPKLDHDGTKRYWVIAPYSADPAEEFLKVWQFDLANNVISIGWTELDDISTLDEQRLRAAIDRTYPDPETSAQAKGQYFGMLWSFYHKIKLGDVIVARQGTKKIVGVGTVIRTAYFDPNKTISDVGDWFTFGHHLDVRWHESPRDKKFDTPVFSMQTVSHLPEERFRDLVGEAGTHITASVVAQWMLDELNSQGGRLNQAEAFQSILQLFGEEFASVSDRGRSRSHERSSRHFSN